MTLARGVISDALTFHLNVLGIGQVLDADTASRCLDALNNIVDEVDGQKGLLFREILTAGVVSAATGTLGATWPTVAPGDAILGATVTYAAGNDLPLPVMTMEQYARIPNKATAGLPQAFAHDGYATLYFWPAATGQTITLRTRQTVQQFADLDTDYGMPAGYRSFFAARLAELMAPTLAPSMMPVAAAVSARARARVLGQTVDPAIINTSRRQTGNILSGWV